LAPEDEAKFRGATYGERQRDPGFDFQNGPGSPQ